MRAHLALLSVVAAALAGCSRSPAPKNVPFPASSVEIRFHATDKKMAYAEFTRTKDHTGRMLVVMFHQAGSGASEYSLIVPKVTALGFDCMAVDLRSGGDMYLPGNKTAAQYDGKIPPGPTGYFAAYRDMEGALALAEFKNYSTIVIWGSSYSASLVLRMASEHPEVSAVLAFSPGEYFDKPGTVDAWNAKVKCPELIACTDEEAGSGVAAISQAGAASRKTNVFFHSKNGVHGSSTLRLDVNPNGNGEYWPPVEQFLRDVAAGGGKS